LNSREVDVRTKRSRNDPVIDLTARWWTTTQACFYLKIGRRLLYHEIANGRLRAAKLGSRGAIRTCREWCDDYVQAAAMPDLVTRRRGAA
jgi:excisionase family DNA binding protein